MKRIFSKYMIYIYLIVVVICGSYIAGYIYFTPVKNVTHFVFNEIQEFELSQRIPAPSAILLFGMGLLGIICVSVNEKRKKHKNSKLFTSHPKASKQ